MNEIVIETENLTKTFGNFTAVNHISFKVFKGEIFGFLEKANSRLRSNALLMNIKKHASPFTARTPSVLSH